MAINSVSIKFKPGTYSVFRNLQNKVWYAIGEYVDNAVQSYENNKTALIAVHGDDYQFMVDIDINWEQSYIRIFDNAGGINQENFPRAFEPANIPLDNTGLHEFGMGMKTASIWLSEVWTVRSAALGESEERLVTFDLQQVLADESEVLDVITTPKSAADHYTEIMLRGLTANAPSAFQMTKLKNHLASIYRKYIRSGQLLLRINTEALNYKDPEILNAPPTTDPEGRSLLWKKDISFTMGKYSAKGFVALLNELSTTEHNGFSLFRRGRVIEGSHDEKYRPKVICGQIGSPRHKRLFGELELEGFDVSFNKGSFQETSEIEALMDALKIELSSKSFNLLKQGDEFRKPKPKENTEKVAKSLVTSLNQENAEKPIEEKIVVSLQEIGNKDIDDNNTKLELRTKVIDSLSFTIPVKDETYHLKMELINEPSISNLYSLSIEDNGTFSKSAVYRINLSHPFFKRFELFRTDEDYKPVIHIIKSLVIAEIYASSQGTKGAGNVRTNFNNFLRNL
ncbi:ATP-binding protein [Mucilaginibacter sp. AK015]|uniref:ATP-binding protein n=1 Tax=Mucilaginibacter sp. AK015 TaxID=2723072 RepID=UPI00160B94BA|nr:ATP-binding protein [Mucilaginibacter sp. AK015]MBB5396703.1 hypothetical protein [Mucilaginibacter sp. AK015]